MNRRIITIAFLLLVPAAAYGQEQAKLNTSEDLRAGSEALAAKLVDQPVTIVTRTMKVQVASARILFLTGTAPDPGPDLKAGTGDDDSAGPFFVVKGNIVTVDGAPARGTFICRGVIFTAKAPLQPDGIAQVNISLDIEGRGLIFGQSVEFRTGQPAGAVLGGTGEFANVSGTYTPEGVPAPLGNGNFSFTLNLQRVQSPKPFGIF